MRFVVAIAVAVAFAGLALWGVGQGKPLSPRYPVAPKQPVTDEYHGVKVVDDYRWLEDLNDPASKKWLSEENAYSRAYLDKLAARGPILARLKQLYTRGPAYFDLKARGGLIFAMKDQPPKNHPMLVVLRAPGDPATERVLVDTDALYPQVPTAIDWYKPSLDGRLVAVSISERGSEDGSVHVFDVASAKPIPDVVPRAQYPTGGGDLEWNRDGTGFYYTRYPQGNERPNEDANFYQQVYLHKLGTPPAQDTYVIGKEFPKIAEITFKTTDDGAYLVVSVANGDGGEFAHYVMNPQGAWTQVTRFSDKIVDASPGKDGRLYLLSRDNAPRGKILAVPLANPVLASAETVVPASDDVIDYFEVGTTRLYVVDTAGGPDQVRVFDLAAKAAGTIPIQPVSSVRQIVPLADGTALYSNETYIQPVAYYLYDPATGTSKKTALAVTTPANFSDSEVLRVFAVSKDGTSVPMSIVRRKATKLTGQNPVLLTGYGGYGLTQSPGFDDWLRLWIEQGGVWAVANIRGGGEYGEEWHQAGNLTRKQNVFDDFIACAKFLIAAGYTSPAKLAIEGGSNGGLLMGAAFTQHPELFRVVLSHVGIYDALRTELSDNGEFNVTEFGTVKDPDQFAALYAYSPYHHVKDGEKYPAILFTGGDTDARVEPMQSRKMTARMQAATASRLPVLLRTNPNAGHGIGTALEYQLSDRADELAFLFAQLGMKYTPLGSRPKAKK
ncbi:MAG TPA: prolyl oligopeptidase family serine peptidase [bacterium]|nr:prolyl oligopeptidase family serine peptidase [bacterium]